MAFEIPDIDETQKPLLDHLLELRTRLMRSLLALAVTSIGCYAFAGKILGFLVRPLAAAFPPGQGRLIYTKLYEAFFVEVKVAVFAGFLLSFPIIANQLWAFVAPGLYAKEKKAFLPFLIATPVLFGCGAAFAYYVVMPNAFRFLLGFAGETGGLRLEALPSALTTNCDCCSACALASPESRSIFSTQPIRPSTTSAIIASSQPVHRMVAALTASTSVSFFCETATSSSIWPRWVAYIFVSRA